MTSGCEGTHSTTVCLLKVNEPNSGINCCGYGMMLYSVAERFKNVKHPNIK
jgi:hypothetical protein